MRQNFAHEFLALPPHARALVCKHLASRLLELACVGTPERRAFYNEIALQWLMLAEGSASAQGG
jgi:hypothetical protein